MSEPEKIYVPLGIVALKYEGLYSPDKEYKKGNWVVHNGSSYAYSFPTPAIGVPITDTDHWYCFAKQGAIIVSGVFANDILTFTKDDGTTFQVNINGITSAATAANNAANLANQKALLADEKATLANQAAVDVTQAIQSTEAATVSALGAQNANANWTKDTANPLSYFPAPSAPLYFRREGTFTQAGSGDPSPTNIRPITPFMANGAQIKLVNSGKNLLPNTLTPITRDGVVFTKNADGSVTIVGTATSNISIMLYGTDANNIPFLTLPPGTYSLSPTSYSTDKCAVGIRKVGNGTPIFDSTASNRTTTLTETTSIGFVNIFIASGAVINTILKPQLELGSVPTAYEPYVGSTATMTAPAEIAAGWINNRGEGQKTWVRKVFDGTETWYANTTSGAEKRNVLYVSGIANPTTTDTVAALFCSHHRTRTANQTYSKNVGVSVQETQIWFYDPNYSTSDISLWKAYLAAQYAAGTPVTVVYQLANPQTIIPVSAPLNSIPATDLAAERLNVFTSSLSGVLTYPKNKVRQDRILNNVQLWRKTASGNPVSAYPVPESPLYPKVSGTFTQAGTGDPSPSNIRPITPWLASGGTVKVKRTGKNLFKTGPLSPATINGITYTPQVDGSILVAGTATANSSYVIAGAWASTESIMELIAGKTYVKHSGMNPQLYGRKNGTGSWTIQSPMSNPTTYVDTYEISNSYLEVGNGTTINTIFYPQIELGSVATAYEPYSGTEITLTAPQEIPAGWMDNEGNGQMTWGKYILNGSETFGVNADLGNVLRVTHSRVTPIASNTSPSVCSHFKQLANYILDSQHYYIDPTIIWMFIPKSVLSSNDVAGVKAYFAAQYSAGTPVTFYYQIATPVALTPAIAPLLSLPQLDRITPRQNVLTASTGNVELTYAKSPIREADELAATIALL